MHSVTAAQSEQNEARVTNTRTAYHYVTFLNLFIDNACPWLFLFGGLNYNVHQYNLHGNRAARQPQVQVVYVICSLEEIFSYKNLPIQLRYGVMIVTAEFAKWNYCNLRFPIPRKGSKHNQFGYSAVTSQIPFVVIAISDC